MASPPNVASKVVAIPVEGGELQGDLTLRATGGLVLFAHGSGSSRHSPRNRLVAQVLVEAGLSTLLLDLLTPAEEEVDRRTAEYRFNIEVLAARLGEATDWAISQPEMAGRQIGYFGASTGAAAAIAAGAVRPDVVHAVVSRGGRPDLAGTALERLAAPTLLIVGGLDDVVIRLNNEAAARMRAPHEVAVVDGASHLFEEPGKLWAVADLAESWLTRHLE